MPQIIAITGFIDSGKTTLAEMFTALDPAHSVHLETSSVIVDLADSFNQAISSQEFPPSRQQQIVIANLGIEHLLPALEEMTGHPLVPTELVITEASIQQSPQSYDKLWSYFADLQGNPELAAAAITVVTKNKYRALLQWIGGYFLYRLDDPLLWYRELERRINALSPDVNFVTLATPRQPAEAMFVQKQLYGTVLVITRPGIKGDMREVTEQGMANIEADVTLLNNGSLVQLDACARQIRDDLANGRLRVSYASGEY